VSFLWVRLTTWLCWISEQIVWKFLISVYRIVYLLYILWSCSIHWTSYNLKLWAFCSLMGIDPMPMCAAFRKFPSSAWFTRIFCQSIYCVANFLELECFYIGMYLVETVLGRISLRLLFFIQLLDYKLQRHFNLSCTKCHFLYAINNVPHFPPYMLSLLTCILRMQLGTP